MEDVVIQYRMHGIDLLEKHIYRRETSLETVYHFNVRTESGVDPKTKVVVIAIEINISKKDDGLLCAQFKMVFAFGIKDFDNVMKKNHNGIFIIPKNLENPLKSISISTARGIVFSELSGTNFIGAILPIVPIDTLKPESKDSGGLLSEFQKLFESKEEIVQKVKAKK